MEIVYLLVPVTLLLVGVGVAVFAWAVKSGQYDDLEGPAHRILYDDDEDLIPEESRVDHRSDDSRPHSGQDDEPERHDR
ncbi:cbb3-type cytochrome oxidase assembly protein CcoS [Marinobacter halodurans]|uniref:Cbb3-type cytochrome oxidase assembly protein CcoS n=1 Tax=Marinobacter halodurans TaxID=2528979 RepID=A0ABY1ZQD7_9GAMM|nr:cbb3-type cytochrome oxidase assembly protein CcoS [Marinobacter halodurans]TBW59162.1 cbb3-type cytochrome oxidase assembly protein CcoS [Marinobacter halodurans]